MCMYVLNTGGSDTFVNTDRKFMNYASCYKHQKTHSRAPHVCHKCGKSFWFPMNFKIHERTHTGCGLIPCTNCTNKYTTCAAMDTHCLMHQGQKFTCQQCLYLRTNTQVNLCQHEPGKHGKGWRSVWQMLQLAGKDVLPLKKCVNCQDIIQNSVSKAEK